MLQGWNITTFGKTVCLFGKNRHRSMDYYIEGTSYKCDCIDYPIYKLVKLTRRTHLIYGVFVVTCYPIQDQKGWLTQFFD